MYLYPLNNNYYTFLGYLLCCCCEWCVWSRSHRCRYCCCCCCAISIHPPTENDISRRTTRNPLAANPEQKRTTLQFYASFHPGNIVSVQQRVGLRRRDSWSESFISARVLRWKWKLRYNQKGDSIPALYSIKGETQSQFKFNLKVIYEYSE